MTAAKIGAKNIYAFNREGGGFVIASADSRTLPVLGYSDSGSIDWERMPENMQAWLLQYDEAIATLGDRMDFKDGNQIIEGSQSRASTRAARTAIEPLIKTRWGDYMAPYNNMAPLYAGHNPEWQGQRCYTGCLAVALAQVLNYWQWPKALPDGLPAYEQIDHNNEIDLLDEISDYLCALPNSAGSGNYKFTAEVPLDIEQDGEYFVWSYLIEWLNDTDYIDGAEHYKTFYVTTTEIGASLMDNGQRPKDQSIYDLQGRKVTVPPKKGIYIKKGKKTMIR